jgi:type I restriction enzyme R subunit
VKRFSATQILRDPELARQASVRAGHFWQTESFDRIVRDTDELARTRAYIATNPRSLRDGEYRLWQAEWLDEFAPRAP